MGQQNQILLTAQFLSLPTSVCGALLRAYNWDKNSLITDFYGTKDLVLKKANINLDSFKYYIGEKDKDYTCPICYDDFKGEEMFSLSCKHFSCKICWKEYLITKINDGPSCLHTKCPFLKCGIIIDETLVTNLVDSTSKERFEKYLTRSFIDDNPHVKWCPAPNCGNAVYCADLEEDAVLCSCGLKFCFKCSNEAHAPSSCDDLVEWLKKEKNDSETINWLVANTKCCPKCKKQIEKNGGCNHMNCSQCRYEFCWICMEDWKNHGEKTGGFYKCNKYKEEELEKKNKLSEKDKAREALEKYNFYYTRYSNHKQSQKFEKQLRKESEDKMKELQLLHKFSSWNDVEFVINAAEQLIECRGSLKYTYVFGYYLQNQKERFLFEFLQQELEQVTEELSYLLEQPVINFDRNKIVNATKSAGKRLEKLISGLKDGLTKEKN